MESDEERLKERKARMRNLVLKASIMNRHDFEETFIRYDQEFIRRVWSGVETKLLKDAIDEL